MIFAYWPLLSLLGFPVDKNILRSPRVQYEVRQKVTPRKTMNIFAPGIITLMQRHSLPRNQVPEWASAYINYKGLKKLIKAAAERAKVGKDVDTAGVHPP